MKDSLLFCFLCEKDTQPWWTGSTLFQACFLRSTTFERRNCSNISFLITLCIARRYGGGRCGGRGLLVEAVVCAPKLYTAVA